MECFSKRIRLVLICLVILIPLIYFNEANNSYGTSNSQEMSQNQDVRAGWNYIDGSWYYFNSSGARVAGWLKIGGIWYYLDPETGVMATGFRQVGNAWYYLNSSGAMQTGWNYIDGSWYYFNSSGARVAGWLKTGGIWYYLDPETGVMATGFRQVGNACYYLNSSGAMQTGWNYIDGSWYYFNSSGARVAGWLKIGGIWYYLDPETGVMATGLKQLGNTWYYLHSSGAMQTGWNYIDGSWYYFNESGARATGWIKVGRTWYYLDSETGVMATGWQNVDGKSYYLNSSGAMESNKMLYSNNGVQYVGYDGALKTAPFQYIKNVTLNPDSTGLISWSEYNSYRSQIEAMENANSILKQVGYSLWEAYKWSGSAITYRNMTTDASNGITYFANLGFNQRSGNCYTMASTFYYMASALGYDVYQISGFHQGRYKVWAHSWCEIRMNGNTYIYDPDVLKETGRTIYGSTYGQSGTLKYILSKNQYMNL